MLIFSSFLRFGGGMLMRIVPLLAMAVTALFGGLKKNKKLLKYAPFAIAAIGLVYYFYQKEEKALIADIKESGSANSEAYMIGKLLGTLKTIKWFSFDGYSEDETAVLDLLEDSSSRIEDIEKHYNEISKNGSLIDDVTRLFSAKELERFYDITGLS